MSAQPWKLVPNKAIGPLEFGMDKASVRDVLGEEYKPFKKSLFSKSKTDEYKDYHVYYSKENELEAIEIFGEIRIAYEGKAIFPGSIENAQNLVPDLVLDSGSYISKSMSIGL